MTLAMKQMRNIGWLALVFIIAILLYPLSLNVAAVHSDLVRLDRKVLETKREISFLEAELSTRASVAQLDEWNQLLYGYEPPTAEQFLDGESALASLGGSEPIVKPVMVSVAASDGVAPAGTVGQPGAAASRLSDDAPSEKKIALNTKEKPVEHNENGPTQRTEDLAKMDAQLLSDTVLHDIQKRSKQERNGK